VQHVPTPPFSKEGIPPFCFFHSDPGEGAKNKKKEKQIFFVKEEHHETQ
jgi:hypothetical protein